jgi:hypothetical protein
LDEHLGLHGCQHQFKVTICILSEPEKDKRVAPTIVTTPLANAAHFFNACHITEVIATNPITTGTNKHGTSQAYKYRSEPSDQLFCEVYTLKILCHV